MQTLMQRKWGKKNKGFTLIELIVVIAIIGILMALAIPRLVTYTETSRETADDQLAALYRNTFAVLLGSGKAAVKAGTSENMTVEIVADGTVGATGTDITGLMWVADNGTETQINDTTDLAKIQKDYISKSNAKDETANYVAPRFQSKKYRDVDGIIITITTSGDVTVALKSAA